MEGAHRAVSGMIDLLGRRFGYSVVDAYMLCSVCADLRANRPGIVAQRSRRRTAHSLTVL
jgi:acetamidase/formamidase